MHSQLIKWRGAPSSAGLEGLAKLDPLVKAIFAIAPETAEEYVWNGKGTTRTRLYFYGDVESEPVGFCLLRWYSLAHAGRPITVVRAGVGMKPEVRGSSTLSRQCFLEAMRYKLTHPTEELWLMGAAIHPSGYSALSKYFREFYPNHRYETPPQLCDLMRDIADDLGLDYTGEGERLLVETGFVERDASSRADRSRVERPDVRFYHRCCPNGPQGVGLMVVLPISASNLTASMLDHVGCSVFGRDRCQRGGPWGRRVAARESGLNPLPVSRGRS